MPLANFVAPPQFCCGTPILLRHPNFVAAPLSAHERPGNLPLARSGIRRHDPEPTGDVGDHAASAVPRASLAPGDKVPIMTAMATAMPFS
jgi:hypothetical protein